MTIEIGHSSKLFDLNEAREHLPLIIAITQGHQSELAPIQARLNRMLSNDPRRPIIERDYEAVVARWRVKIENIGVAVKGLWLVEFDVGEAVLSWRFPELSINYVRLNEQSFASRIKLKDYIEQYDPDWA
jgi:hypothetical protein